MNNLSKNIYLTLLVIGIIFSLIGVFGVFNPLMFSIYLIEILAIFFFMNGVKNLVKGIQLIKNPNVHWSLFILLSILEIIAALSLLITPFSSQIFIIIYIGFIMLLKGIFVVFNSLFHKNIFPGLSSVTFSNGLIDILFGILLIVVPFISQQFIFLCVAWYILFSGINLVMMSFSIKRNIL
ncbi:MULTISPECIES: HdeD family acid-resistance protein [Cetobacterium]|uniref:Acid-resistance membrane protein n=1 Tax=Cetobacterium somerae ATCC BAA-474 TaxID=1319815 RepID=U7VBR8_9FUSO|nr:MULTISPECIES: DUF308 domain-containing protein [Cetobacterium]ERT68213.1 hypothetical protein HMPREF0202_01923 [Cetobacterium somerae ATCC BAA-474]MBC2852265.1 DUF308 domain-containing protein [Cetobacterium sp. 2G large]MCQ9628128.1 DUF308 domain-containing protein [Cetobacterium somerae]WVJ03268.1 DUF308 domain-containing protein [Cetobacterium somerae]